MGNHTKRKMYINETHIGFYLVAVLLGAIVGQLCDWMNKRLPEYKKVFTKEIIQEYKINVVLRLNGLLVAHRISFPRIQNKL